MGQSKKEKNRRARERRVREKENKKNVMATGKTPAIVKEKLTPVPRRIRMLIACANQNRSFAPGDTFQVPQEIPVKTARGWINVGTAEDISDQEVQKEKVEEQLETKILDIEETKDEEPEGEIETPGIETDEDPGEILDSEKSEEPPEEKEPEDPPEEEETKEIPVDNKE